MSKTLLKGGTVLSMDPQVGDLDVGDVLVEDGKISAVKSGIDADAEVIDCTGKILIPGFIDSHRHTWEAAIRGCAPNATLDDYFVEVLEEGMVFALETYWPGTDGWSAARIEEEVVVTADGCEVITKFPAEDLLIAGQRYWTVGGALPSIRESQSHLNTAAGRGEA